MYDLAFLYSHFEHSVDSCKKDEFLDLATPGGSWSLKRHYFDALPLSVRFGSRYHED